ncbi:MAG TPA: chloride channel protein, partial [Trueperaceae bacterium]
VLFALEVILGRFTNKYFGSVVIGAVAASVVSRSFLGPAPAFRVPDYGLGNPLELPLYFLLGLLAAFVAVGVIRTMVGVENLLNALNPPAWLRPALGGLAIGLLGLLLPQVLGRGYDITGGIVQGDIQGVGLLLALCAAKILAMNISLGAWHSGGIFAPLLFIGAAFGAAVGEGFAVVFPDLGIVPGAFALVGMAAVFAGAERAPMSTIVLVFEMSGDYRLILPLLLAAVVATLVADIFHPESIYHVMLSRKGLSLLKQRGSDLLQTVTVGEVMDKKVPTLYIDDTIEDMEDAVSNSPRRGFVLVKRGEPSRLEGIATLSDLARARRAGAPPETPLADIATRTVACALPDEPVGEALERMALRGISRMPVVAARDRLRPVGYVTQSHLARGYYQALQRERTLELSEEVRRLRELTGQEIVEVRLRAASPMVGKTLRDAALPKESIVVAIRRHGRTVFPHGETRFEVGDVVVANVAPGFSHDFRARFAGQPAAPPNEDADAPKETER